MKTISIVIPCYNSSKTISTVVDAIQKFFDMYKQFNLQIILADDHSPDDTFNVIKHLADKYDNVTGIRLTRNYGQASARMAAISYAEGDVIISMDDDGQHPVERIIDLINEIENGADFVYARFITKKTTLFKKITSSITRKIYQFLGLIPPRIYVSSFFAINGKFKEQIKNYNSPFPSLGTYLYQYTSKFANIDIEQQSRLKGKSGYRLGKLFNLFFNTITNFSIIPIRCIIWLGLGFGFLNLLWLVFQLIGGFIKIAGVNEFTILINIIGIFFSILLFSVGLVGEYVVRIYVSVSGKPQFCIDSKVGKETLV